MLPALIALLVTSQDHQDLASVVRESEAREHAQIVIAEFSRLVQQSEPNIKFNYTCIVKGEILIEIDEKSVANRKRILSALRSIKAKNHVSKFVVCFGKRWEESHPLPSQDLQQSWVATRVRFEKHQEFKL